MASGRRVTYIFVLGALVGLGPLTIDLYLPAFPRIASDFATSDTAVQLTLSGMTIGFALGQILAGPISDRVGRRPPLFVATAVHVLACVAAAAAPDIFALGVFRLLQGLGAAASAVVALAAVRDLFAGRRLVVILSRLALVSATAPIFAPVIGSWILAHFDWRGIFWVLASLGSVVIVLTAVFLRETLPAAARMHAIHTSYLYRYRSVLGDRTFIGIVIIGGMTYGGLFSYLSASPFLFQDHYNLSAQEYGLFFTVNSIGMVIGTQVSARLTKIASPQSILAGSTAGLIVFSALIGVLDQAGSGFWGTVIPLWFFIVCCGFTIPCVQGLALAKHSLEAGTAASVLGAANFGAASLISPLVGIFGATSATPVALIMVATSIIGAAVLWVIVRPGTAGRLSSIS